MAGCPLREHRTDGWRDGWRTLAPQRKRLCLSGPLTNDGSVARVRLALGSHPPSPSIAGGNKASQQMTRTLG
jgi:hypothetical protein